MKTRIELGFEHVETLPLRCRKSTEICLMKNKDTYVLPNKFEK